MARCFLVRSIVFVMISLFMGSLILSVVIVLAVSMALSTLKFIAFDFKIRSITKDKINKRGYNKFLEIDKDVKAVINYDKIKEDERWDGWKGYITNTELLADKVYEEYSELWQVERAFRIRKGTLELRPMFHFYSKKH